MSLNSSCNLNKLAVLGAWLTVIGDLIAAIIVTKEANCQEWQKSELHQQLQQLESIQQQMQDQLQQIKRRINS